MKKIYKSKVDKSLVVILLFVTLAPITPLLYMDFSVVAFFIVIILLLFIFLLLFNIRYIIDRTSLIVKCGFFFTQEFNVKDLQSIKRTSTLLSAPAASLDRLELNFNGTSVVVSPKEMLDFIETLKNVCPHDVVVFI